MNESLDLGFRDSYSTRSHAQTPQPSRLAEFVKQRPADREAVANFPNSH